MARLPAFGLVPWLIGLSVGCASAQESSATAKLAPAAVALAAPAARTESAPARVAPSRPAPAPVLWAVTSLRGTDYVSLREVAQRFSLKAAWAKPEVTMTLSDARGVRLVLEGNEHDFYFDNLRIFLGAPVLHYKDGLWISLLDAIKIVAPLLRPATHFAFLPQTAPKLIVLDPGHGGIDPGAENKRLRLNEKTLTLEVALRLKPLLEARGWRVLLTRTEDRELSRDKKTDLLMRNEYANRQKADVFLSIHFNSAPDNITGIETYVMAPRSMRSTGDELGDEMTKVAYPSNRFDYANLLFGAEMHRALRATLKTPDRGYKRSRLAVLRMLDCPGVLVECGYLSNETEARRLATPAFRQQIAEALAAGLDNYASALTALRTQANSPTP